MRQVMLRRWQITRACSKSGQRRATRNILPSPAALPGRWLALLSRPFSTARTLMEPKFPKPCTGPRFTTRIGQHQALCTCPQCQLCMVNCTSAARHACTQRCDQTCRQREFTDAACASAEHVRLLASYQACKHGSAVAVRYLPHTTVITRLLLMLGML